MRLDHNSKILGSATVTWVAGFTVSGRGILGIRHEAWAGFGASSPLSRQHERLDQPDNEP